ncbi:hypothetical protein MUN82_07805 [Hymenobacter aerilatus]|uniref:Tetratricopeptide repeat protein n=1 Tax=Hymenobacter aerilatus TaxID=2932251 RepID=A0A8T9T1Z9_9BACT|nr:hypothetical protein [Hymenobacter aerilatus]UOR06993.1 hypothetical protein MUN82_07805 [Hymenobacter aerilatus]
MKRYLLVLGLLGCLAGRSIAASMATATDSMAVQKLLKQARMLQAAYQESEALGKYEEALRQDSRCYEALWQAALLSVRIGARYTDETRRGAYFISARQYADRALVVQPTGGEANYVVALSLVNRATLLTARSRLHAYKLMKPYAFMAVARCPEWADAWQLLGRWHYRVDHYNVLERVFSKLFLGGMPSEAGSRKAIDALRRAHQLDSTRIQFCYDLARVYRNQRQRRNARLILEKAVQLTPTTSDELEVSRRCRAMLLQDRRRQKRRPASFQH